MQSNLRAWALFSSRLFLDFPLPRRPPPPGFLDLCLTSQYPSVRTAPSYYRGRSLAMSMTVEPLPLFWSFWWVEPQVFSVLGASGFLSVGPGLPGRYTPTLRRSLSRYAGIYLVYPLLLWPTNLIARYFILSSVFTLSRIVMLWKRVLCTEDDHHRLLCCHP